MISILRRTLGALMMAVTAYWIALTLSAVGQTEGRGGEQDYLYALIVASVVVLFVANTLNGAFLVWKGTPVKILSAVALGAVACLYLLDGIKMEGLRDLPQVLAGIGTSYDAFLVGCIFCIMPVLYLIDLLLPPWPRFGGPRDG